MKRLLSLTLMLLLGSGASAASGFDPATFIAEKCSNCHDERVYTRPDHRMRNRQQLEAQVRRCDANVGTHLFDDDIAALVDYLDRKYYHFHQ